MFFSTCCIAQELHIYNGSEYTAFYRDMKNHPFLTTDLTETGDVFYDGALYKNLRLNYNIADNQVYFRYEKLGYNHRRTRRAFDKMYKVPTFTQQLKGQIATSNQRKAIQ